MAANTRRHTPGLLLTAWALGFSTLVLFSWRVFLHRQQFEWCEYPTALGDTAYYTGNLGENDFYQPMLRYSGAKEGLYRQTVNPVRKLDRLMLRVEMEGSGRYMVYAEGHAADKGQVYLKTGEDRFVAFGKRTRWPAYQPMKAVPLTEEEARKQSTAEKLK